MSEIHLFEADDRWGVKCDGNLIGIFESRQIAVRSCVALATKHHALLVVHGVDGTIVKQHNYGIEPAGTGADRLEQDSWRRRAEEAILQTLEAAALASKKESGRI